jgi:hypothetical protein
MIDPIFELEGGLLPPSEPPPEVAPAKPALESLWPATRVGP